MADSKKGAGDNSLGQYKYANMSNLVLQADRRFVSRRGDEDTGDPESLAGRINLADMGSRNAREAAPVQQASQEQARKRKRTETAKGSRKSGILSQADLNIEGLRYRPRTAATKDVYDLIATNVAQKMGGDYGLEITASATDSILEFLKTDSIKDFDKKKEIDDILGIQLSSQEFNQLVNLGKKITDYDAQDEDEDMRDDNDDEDGLDEREGVAVDFGADDEEDDEDARNFEVREDGGESDDDLRVGEDDAAGDDDNQARYADDGGDDEMVLDNSVERRGQGGQDELSIPAHEIDAYWLQRQIGQIYEDAHIQTEKTREAEAIITSTSAEGEENSLREVENDLMELFDYEHHELVGKLVRNRDICVDHTMAPSSRERL